MMKTSIFPQNNAANPQNRTWYSVRNAAPKLVEIAITDEIGYWGVSASRLRAQIQSLTDDTDIKVYIYSPGGDVLEGNEIYNALVAHKGKVEVEIGALCASIATVIAMAGTKITMADNGLFMVHNPWVFAGGEAEDLRRLASVLDKMKGTIMAAYEKRTGKTAPELAKIMDEETWMTAQEAKDAGFITDILKTEEDSDIEARYDTSVLNRFKNFASAFSKVSGKHRGTGAIAQAGNRTEPPPAGEPQKPKASPPTKPSARKNRTPSLLASYMKGHTRIFNSILATGIMAAIAGNSVSHLCFDPPERTPSGGSGDPTPEEEARAKSMAVQLYQAKLKRDKEIDDITAKVLERDKKDFSALANKFKAEDKTADEFARALTMSDDFKNVAPGHAKGSGGDNVGSGVEVVGVVGLPKGSPGEVFVSSEGYKAAAAKLKSGHHNHATCSIETRDFVQSALIEAAQRAGLTQMFTNTMTSAGLTSIEKLPGIVTLGVRPLRIKDLIAPGSTNSTTIRYMREVSVTPGATTVAEGAAKPSVGFVLEEVDSPVKKIAAWTKVTDELFADFLAVASYINVRLPYFVERCEEDQLLTGDGTGTNLKGILNQTGLQTRARAWDATLGRAESPMDAIYKAFTKVRWGNLGGTAQGGFEPDAIVLHPLDWDAMRLSVDANGQYFAGGPFTGAYGNVGMVQYEMLWQKPVVLSPAITQGTALVGAFRMASQYFQRQGMTIDSTNMDQDDFIKNLTTIRAELRLALAVYRPQAFCTVTALGTLPTAPV